MILIVWAVELKETLIFAYLKIILQITPKIQSILKLKVCPMALVVLF